MCVCVCVYVCVCLRGKGILYHLKLGLKVIQVASYYTTVLVFNFQMLNKTKTLCEALDEVNFIHIMKAVSNIK